ncbi:MAG TPA: efflux RND transporter periplasmic adaptor subunit [Anaerolineales bacterium]
MNGKILFFGVGVILISMLVSACGSVSDSAEQTSDPQPILDIDDDIVSASAEVIAGSYANLSFALGGSNVEVFVKAGDSVKEGQVLASFPEDFLPQSIINAKADLILAQDALEDLLVVDTALAQAVISLRAAQEAYEDAVDNREALNGEITYKEITTKIEDTPFGKVEVPKVKEYKGFATEEQKTKADESLALAKAILDDAQREIDRLRDLETTAEVQAASTRIEAVESVIQQAQLIAPFDGTVVEMYVNSGEMISPGMPVLLLADLSSLQVKTTDLNEVDVARIQLGNTVKVTFDALSDAVITGRVSEISLKNSAGSGVYYDIFILLDEFPENLRWGMSAFVEIQVEN